MSDYATRRDAGIDKTLAAIDAATNRTCLHCGGYLSPKSKSDLFCGQDCQHQGLASQAAEQVPEGWRGPGASNLIREAIEEDRRNDPGPTVREVMEFRRLYLNNPVAAVGATTEEIMAAAERFAEAMGQEGATIRVHIPAPAKPAMVKSCPQHAKRRREFAYYVVAAIYAVIAVGMFIDDSWVPAVIWTICTPVWIYYGRRQERHRKRMIATCRDCQGRDS